MKFAENFAVKFVLTWSGALFVSFILGFVVRLILEVLLFPYPIGYDPIFYVWRIRSGVVWYNWSQVFSTWLFYGMLMGFSNVMRADPFFLVKAAGPLLFGFNACAVFYFASKGLGWTVKKALLASVFFSVQAAALLISVNFYKNMLGLGILLFALPLIKNNFKNARQFLVFVLLSVLVVFSHEYGSVTLLAAVFGLVLTRFVKSGKADLSWRLIAVLPAFALFFASLYFWVFPVQIVVEKNAIAFYEYQGNYPGALFFLRNYLVGFEAVQYYQEYLNIASLVFSTFVVLYIVILPLVLAGFFRDSMLDSWTLVLLVGSFGVLVMPFFALEYWNRWLFMLVYPFTFYAVNGITKILRWSRTSVSFSLRSAKLRRLSRIALLLAMILPFFCGPVFIAGAVQNDVFPLRDVGDAVEAMRWLNLNMDDNSVLLAHFAFIEWARLCLDESHARIYFVKDFEGAVDLALQRGFNGVYFAWWNEIYERYDLAVPESFVSVFDSGRVSVFEYSW